MATMFSGIPQERMETILPVTFAPWTSRLHVTVEWDQDKATSEANQRAGVVIATSCTALHAVDTSFHQVPHHVQGQRISIFSSSMSLLRSIAAPKQQSAPYMMQHSASPPTGIRSA